MSLVFYGALLQILVRRRTRELSETLEQQRRMEVEAREHRRRLGHLERRNIVNQMSGMIALKQFARGRHLQLQGHFGSSFKR